MVKRLEALGWGCIVAHTHAQASELAARGGFCVELVDLEVPASVEDAEGFTESGLRFIEEERDRFPQRDLVAKCHLMPIVVVSSHAGDHPNISLAYQNGADASVSKPVPHSNPSFSVVLESVMRKSGRLTHADCARRTAEAFAPVEAPPKVVLSISAREAKSNRRFIEVGKESIALRTGSLFIIARLVLARLDGARDGWVHRTDLGCPAEGDGWDGIRRLNEDVKAFFDPRLLVENNNRGKKYRLHPTVAVDWKSIEVDALADHGDERLQIVAKALRAKLGAK